MVLISDHLTRPRAAAFRNHEDKRQDAASTLSLAQLFRELREP